VVALVGFEGVHNSQPRQRSIHPLLEAARPSSRPPSIMIEWYWFRFGTY
jgi:hypothetical protein